MPRELLLEIGCEELPAGWLPALTQQIGQQLAARLAEQRLTVEPPIETFSTPRRLAAYAARVSERQPDVEETVTGPPLVAAFDRDGRPTAAALGFARKQGVEVGELSRVESPRGAYVACHRRVRGRAAAEVLPAVLAGVLRGLVFPKLMQWDARLDDGRGALLFGRPIRWLLFLYGGQVVPFTIHRTDLGQSALVQAVQSGAVTFGHRFLSTTGRPGRAIRVRRFDEYRRNLSANFVLLDRNERHDKIVRELDAHARRLGGRVSAQAAHSALLEEVPDLVEYPSVVAGTFAAEFLALPEEILTTTMIHHQHYFPVANDVGRLMPAFLAVVNTRPDDDRLIAANGERVLAARLRDAQFFWNADRKLPLTARVDRLETLLFHQRLGSYRAKALRLEALAPWIVAEVLRRPDLVSSAQTAALLAKADLVTDVVREFTELQGTMGGIYAREEGHPEPVWKAIYYHYLPVSAEPGAPPGRADLGEAAVCWAGVALADKLDTLVGLVAAGERPTGSRDPFGLRRQAQGIARILIDAPELAGIAPAVSIDDLFGAAARQYGPAAALDGALQRALRDELLERARFLFARRGFAQDEINAVFARFDQAPVDLLDARRRLEALRAARASEEFEALAVAFKRVKNLAKEFDGDSFPATDLLREAAEITLLEEYRLRAETIRSAARLGDYGRALKAASGFRPAVDRFFADVFVMVDDPKLREQRLGLVWGLHVLLLELADISEVVPRPESGRTES